MFDPIRREANSIDADGSPARDHSFVQDREVAEQVQRLLGRIYGARRPFREACRVIGMSMREHDRRRRDGIEPVKPICPAIDHDPGEIRSNEQRAVPPMPTRSKLDLAPRTEK
jgi:hypothetical protein